jgi:hypothetical protein
MVVYATERMDFYVSTIREGRKTAGARCRDGARTSWRSGRANRRAALRTEQAVAPEKLAAAAPRRRTIKNQTLY